MKKWHITITLLLVFAVGTAVGAFGTRITLKQRIQKVLYSEGPPGIRAMQGMVDRLDLSDAQRTSIKTILDSSSKKWEELRQNYEPQVKELFENTIEETKKELTDQQQKEMEQMSANIRRRLPREAERSATPPRSAAPPSSSTPPQSTPSPEEPSFNPQPESDPSAKIMEQLHVDASKTAEIEAIIRSGQQAQDALQKQFGESKKQAQDTFQKARADLQVQTEQKLSGLLSADQLQQYKQLTNRTDDHQQGFDFDLPMEVPNDKGFK